VAETGEKRERGAVERGLEFSVRTRPMGSKIRRKEKIDAWCFVFGADNFLRGGINCENSVNLTAVIYSPSDQTVENSKLMRIKKMKVTKTLLLCII